MRSQSANRSYSPQYVSSSLWLRRSARSTANPFRSSLPDCRNGAHPTRHTGSLRNTTGVDPRTHIAPIGCLLHFSEHRVTANFVGRGMPSAKAWRPGSAGWFDCGNLIRSSVLYERQCSIKGRLWEGNRRKYAQFEVTAHDPNQTLRSPKGLPLALPGARQRRPARVPRA